MLNRRGVIRDREYATQVRDFSGLRWGTITPTDIDGFIDFGNRAFVVIEIKFDGAALPRGQRLAIARLVDAVQESGRLAFGLVAKHETGGDIDVGNCIVTEYRWRMKWHDVDGERTTREVIDGFLLKHKEVPHDSL